MSLTSRGLPIFITLVLCVYLLRNIHPSDSPSFKRNLEVINPDTNPALLEDLCKDFVFNSSMNASRIGLFTKLTSYLTTFRGGNRLINLVNSIAAENHPVQVLNSASVATARESQTQLGKSYAWSMAIPMIFMVFFLLSSMLCMAGFCCTSINCCSKLCCCFFLANGERGKVPFFILAALFLGGVVFMGALGMKTSAHIDDDSAVVACTMSFIVNDIIKGNLTRGWLGLNTTADKMDYILTNATRLANDVNNLNVVNTNIQNLLGSINTANLNAYNNFAGKTLSRPDTTTPAGKTYVPDFITNLGPQDDMSRKTTTGSFAEQINTFLYPLTKAASSMVAAISTFQSGNTIALPAFQKGKDLSLQGATFAQNFIDKGNSYSDEIQTIFNISEGSVRKVFKGVLWVAVACVGLALINLLGIIKFPIFVNLAWFTLLNFSIICWIAAIILVPTNITFMETCDAVDVALSNSTFFNNVVSLTTDNPTAVNQYIYPCLFGSADLPSIFGIVGTIESFQNLANLTAAAGIDISNNVSVIPKTLTSLPSAISTLDSYRTNAVADSQAITDDLKTLNINSNSENTCEPMKDTWTLSSSSCTGTKLMSTHTDTYNAGAPTCIGFDQWSTGNKKDIVKRYNTLKYIKDCSEQPDEDAAKVTQNLVPAFVNNRAELQSLVSDVMTSVNTVGENYKAFTSQMNSLASSTDSMNGAISTLSSLLTNPTDGVMTHLKCSMIPEDLRVFQDSVCNTTVPNMFYISLLVLGAALFASFASICMFCLARKLSPPPQPEDLDATRDSDDQEKQKKKKKKTVAMEMMPTRVY